MNHWKKHDLGHFRLSSKSSIFPPVIYSVPRAPPQARAHNLPPAARGFIALGLIKSPLTATEVCSPPHREGIAATSCGRALTPGLPSAPGNAGAITHLCPRPPPLPPAALPPRAALPAHGRRPAAWAVSSQGVVSIPWERRD